MLLKFVLSHLSICFKPFATFDVIAVSAKTAAFDFFSSTRFAFTVVAERVSSRMTNTSKLAVVMKISVARPTHSRSQRSDRFPAYHADSSSRIPRIRRFCNNGLNHFP